MVKFLAGLKGFGGVVGNLLFQIGKALFGTAKRAFFVFMIVSMIMFYSDAIKESWDQRDPMIFVTEVGGRMVLHDYDIQQEVEQCTSSCEHRWEKYQSLKNIMKGLWGLMAVMVVIFVPFYLRNTSAVLTAVFITLLIVTLLQIFVIGWVTGEFHIPFEGVWEFMKNLDFYFEDFIGLIKDRVPPPSTNLTMMNSSNLTG